MPNLTKYAGMAEIESSYQRYMEGLDPQLMHRIQSQQSALQNGMYVSAPLMCAGPEKCRIISHCPIPETDQDGKVSYGAASNYPIGRQCIVERLFMQSKTVALAAFLQVDPSNPIEIAIVGELALIDLQKNRVVMLMAKGDRDGQGQDFLRYDSKGFDEHGNPLEETKLHPWVDFLDKLEKRRQSHLDRLMATRKAKAELASRSGDAMDSRLVREIEQLRGAIEALGKSPTMELPDTTRVMLDDK